MFDNVPTKWYMGSVYRSEVSIPAKKLSAIRNFGRDEIRKKLRSGLLANERTR